MNAGLFNFPFTGHRSMDVKSAQGFDCQDCNGVIPNIGHMRLTEIRPATTFEPRTYVYRCPATGNEARVTVRT